MTPYLGYGREQFSWAEPMDSIIVPLPRVSVHPPTGNPLALRERVRVIKIKALQMPSPPAPLPQGEGGERLLCLGKFREVVFLPNP